jgi:hypothetical protein
MDLSTSHMNLLARHTSTNADRGNIYIKLEKVCNETGGICCVDSAFLMRNQPYMIRSSQSDITGTGATTGPKFGFDKNQQGTSMQQCSEWGMRVLQSSFPCLNDKFLFETKGEWKIQ